MKYAVDLKETFINLLYISVEEEFFHQFFFIAKDIRLIAVIMMINTDKYTDENGLSQSLMFIESVFGEWHAGYSTIKNNVLN